MGKAGDEEELKEDEPDPIQVGRLSNRKVRVCIVSSYEFFLLIAYGISYVLTLSHLFRYHSTHLTSLDLSVDSSSSGEARDEAQAYDIELSPRLKSSITTLTVVDLEGGFDNSSEEKECAQDVSNDAKRNQYSSNTKEAKYDEETQEKRDKEEMGARRRKDVAVVGLAKAMTRVARAQNGDTKKKTKKSKGQYPRINIKESASVFENLVKADIIVARRHGKEKAGD